MEWFKNAKLGIFIHWGIYSVNGISESWSFFNNYINHENYMKQLNGFSASKYQPEQWVNLIKESGAKYAVITTKHHDGVSLWNSKAEKATSIPQNSLAQKDVLSPFVTALKNSGLKTGLYFSLPDWSHPYYDINTRTKKRYEIKMILHGGSILSAIIRASLMNFLLSTLRIFFGSMGTGSILLRNGRLLRL
ncbi:alpha-L-fucosidase [Chryseobacterium sp. 1B4]